MAGLVYFVPNQAPAVAKREQFAKIGLGYAFEADAGAAQVTSGPNGQPGIVLADKSLPENLRGYYPQQQKWMAIPQHPAGAWVGLFEADRPKPVDLARKQQLAGYSVTLADDQTWLVPVARKLRPDGDRLPWYCALPTRLGFDSAGEWDEGRPTQRYEALWDLACRWWDAVVSAEVREETAIFQFVNLADGAVAALQANYRVHKVECVLLDMLTLEHAREVLNALVDWPVVIEWLKKKASQETTP